MSGAKITIDHRFGGHGGHQTEWEISTEIPFIARKIRALEAQNHPELCEFCYDGAADLAWFCVKQDAPDGLFLEVVAYLTALDPNHPFGNAWPQEEFDPHLDLCIDRDIGLSLDLDRHPTITLSEVLEAYDGCTMRVARSRRQVSRDLTADEMKAMARWLDGAVKALESA